jgi:hypothetical protein
LEKSRNPAPFLRSVPAAEQLVRTLRWQSFELRDLPDVVMGLVSSGFPWGKVGPRRLAHIDSRPVKVEHPGLERLVPCPVRLYRIAHGP